MAHASADYAPFSYFRDAREGDFQVLDVSMRSCTLFSVSGCFFLLHFTFRHLPRLTTAR